jgi:Flp pilus assembly protein TadD
VVIGQILTSAHDAAGAAEAFTEPRRLNRITADSQAAVFAVNAGLERLKRNDLAGAIAKFREAIRLSPDSAQAHYRLALGLHRRGAAAEARREYEAARRLAPYLRW